MFKKNSAKLFKTTAVAIAIAYMFTSLGIENAQSLGTTPATQVENFDNSYSLGYGLKKAERIMTQLEGAGSLKFKTVEDVANMEVFLKNEISDLEFSRNDGEVIITIAGNVTLRIFDPQIAPASPVDNYKVVDHALNQKINDHLEVTVLCRIANEDSSQPSSNMKMPNRGAIARLSDEEKNAAEDLEKPGRNVVLLANLLLFNMDLTGMDLNKVNLYKTNFEGQDVLVKSTIDPYGSLKIYFTNKLDSDGAPIVDKYIRDKDILALIIREEYCEAKGLRTHRQVKERENSERWVETPGISIQDLQAAIKKRDRMLIDDTCHIIYQREGPDAVIEYLKSFNEEHPNDYVEKTGDRPVYGYVQKKIEELTADLENPSDLETPAPSKPLPSSESTITLPDYTEATLKALEDAEGVRYKAGIDLKLSSYKLTQRIDQIKLKATEIDDKETLTRLGKALVKHLSSTLREMENSKGNESVAARKLKVTRDAIHKRMERIKAWAESVGHKETLDRLENIEKLKLAPKVDSPEWAEKALAALKKANGNREAASKLMGIGRKSFTERINTIRENRETEEWQNNKELLVRLEEAFDRVLPHYAEDIVNALEASNGDRSKAADALDISLFSFRYREKRVARGARLSKDKAILERLEKIPAEFQQKPEVLPGYTDETIAALEKSDGRITETAQNLGVAHPSLIGRIKQIRKIAVSLDDKATLAKLDKALNEGSASKSREAEEQSDTPAPSPTNSPEALPDYTEETITALKAAKGRRDNAAKILGVKSIQFRIRQIQDRAIQLNDQETLNRLENAMNVLSLPEYTEEVLTALEEAKGKASQAAMTLKLDWSKVMVRLDNIVRIANALERNDIIDRINSAMGRTAGADAEVAPDEASHPAQKSSLYIGLPSDKPLSINQIINYTEMVLSAIAFEESDKNHEFIKATDEYLTVNKDIVEQVFNNNSEPIAVRVPIEVLESEENRHVIGWLNAVSKNEQVFVELYSMQEPDTSLQVAALYEKYGLHMSKFPEKKQKTNTISLFAASRDMDKDEIQKAFQTSESLRNSIIVPLGLKGDSTGIIRATLFGFGLIQVARNPKDKKLAAQIVLRYESVVSAYHLGGAGLTVDDVQHMAIGLNINSLINTLKKIISSLPAEILDPQERIRIYERALKVAQAA